MTKKESFDLIFKQKGDCHGVYCDDCYFHKRKKWCFDYKTDGETDSEGLYRLMKKIVKIRKIRKILKDDPK